jgi:hypothetical protein
MRIEGRGDLTASKSPKMDQTLLQNRSKTSYKIMKSSREHIKRIIQIDIKTTTDQDFILIEEMSRRTSIGHISQPVHFPSNQNVNGTSITLRNQPKMNRTIAKNISRNSK